jgi:polar amino acid transport system substrate-binding protein
VRKSLVLLAVLTLALLAACGSSSKNEGSSTTTTAASGTPTTNKQETPAPVDCNGTPASDTTIGNVSDFKPVKADTLSVVTSLPGPGFWEGSDTDPTKLKSGYEWDIAHELQQAFGLSKFEVRNVSFDAIVAGTVKDYDVSFSQISITCDRAKVAKFSIPYFYSNQSALVKSDFSKPLATVDDAKNLRWGVQTGTTAIDLLDRMGANKRQVYQQLPDAYTALQAGQVDGVMIDTAINLGEAARSSGKFKVAVQFDKPGTDQYGALLPKDSTNAGAINAEIKNLQDSGKLQELAVKDLTADPGTIPFIHVS